MTEALIIYIIGFVLWWGVGLAIIWKKGKESTSESNKQAVSGAFILGVIWPVVVVACITWFIIKAIKK